MLSFKSYIGLQYHKTLNPKLFHNDILKEPVRQHLITIGQKFQEYAKVDSNTVVDYHLTGGNTNYNYNNTLSDLDLHVFVDHTKITDPDMFHNYIMLAKNEWTKNHPGIDVEGFPVECYAQLDSEFQPANQGVYSLFKNTWLIHPTWIDIKYNQPELKQKYRAYEDAANAAIQADDLDSAKNIKDQITSARGPALQTEMGEFSLENEIFKAARNSGLLQKLSDFIQTKEDKALSYH